MIFLGFKLLIFLDRVHYNKTRAKHILKTETWNKDDEKINYDIYNI